MRIKEGDIVFAIKDIHTTLGACKAGHTFAVVRVTSTHVIGAGLITLRSNVSLYPMDAKQVEAIIRKEIGI